jgi:ParB family transcriptional regulator, chromosome partitioning protein
MSADAPRRLGRGLEALITTAKQQRDPSTPAERSKADLQRLRIQDIQANPFQPRRTFTPEDLADLESSLKASGLIQPITVRARSGGGYELVAGERRLRAATRLGWAEIPALIRDFDDQAMLTLALVENLQRANLNPLEEAEGYQRLIDEFGLTQQQVGEAVGKDRTTITNLLRVLTLPAPVRQLIQQGQLSAGHARALLALKDERKQTALAQEIVAHGLSVREVEARARGTAAVPEQKGPLTRKPIDGPAATNDPATRRVEEQLRKRLQTDVSIQQTGNERGVVRISFYSHDDLERVLDLVLGQRSDFE